MRMTVRFWPEGPPRPWAGQEPAPAWAFHVPFLCHEWLHDFGEVHKTTDLHKVVTYFRFTLQAFRLMDTSLVCRSLKNVPRFYCFDKENLNRTWFVLTRTLSHYGSLGSRCFWKWTQLPHLLWGLWRTEVPSKLRSQYLSELSWENGKKKKEGNRMPRLQSRVGYSKGWSRSVSKESFVSSIAGDEFRTKKEKGYETRSRKL